MKAGIYEAPIVDIARAAEGFYEITARQPELSQGVQPGQFFQVAVGGTIYAHLRRPFSYFRTDGEHLSILFEVVGEGTRWLSGRKRGDLLNLLGPFGNSFPMVERPSSPAILVGGGIGIPPLWDLGRRLTMQGAAVRCIVGARTAAAVLAVAALRETGADVRVATDDGTQGFHGTAAALLADMLQEAPAAAVYTCGPMAMMRAVKEVSQRSGSRCFVSLESQMACGMGACLGCPVEVVGPAQELGAYGRFARICMDGPVFDAVGVQLG